jgi:uncharacterized membrane protein YsdA (DUF1294 family)
VALIDLSVYFPLKALAEYIGAWSVFGFAAMLWDKFSAIIGVERLSERSLATVALLGGFLGVIAGGLLAHHKTSKPEFWPPIGFAGFLWVMFLVAYFNPWILPF